MIIAVLVAALGTARADDDRPGTGTLVLAGIGMAVPTYFLGVIAHEGSHALVGKLAGGEVVEFRILPGRNPRTGAFHFGYTRIAGAMTRGEKTWFFLAPKLTDMLMLGGYAALLELDAVPDNRYGRLALAVLATGFWVDFSKDIFSRRPYNDMVRLYDLRGWDSEWRRLPWRALHLGVSLATAYVVYRGYEGVFEDEPVVVPLVLGSF